MLSEGRLSVPNVERLTLMHKHHDEIGDPVYEKYLRPVRKTTDPLKYLDLLRKYVKFCMHCAFAKDERER